MGGPLCTRLQIKEAYAVAIEKTAIQGEGSAKDLTSWINERNQSYKRRSF
ncbi:hypothetical protein AABD41_00100 [Staphylococcus pseudoxylosus]